MFEQIGGCFRLVPVKLVLTFIQGVSKLYAIADSYRDRRALRYSARYKSEEAWNQLINLVTV